MPIYFGYHAHRQHGVPWRQPRSGKQMQEDPGFTCKGAKLKQIAEGRAEHDKEEASKRRRQEELADALARFKAEEAAKRKNKN